MKNSLPQRVFHSPSIEFANFQDGSFVNLIKLNRPYASGYSYAVYDTTDSPFGYNGLFKTYEKAKEMFDQRVKNGQTLCPLRDAGIIDHSKPYPNHITYYTL